jgi:diguanylate cyclase (GGDEF)-like protein
MLNFSTLLMVLLLCLSASAKAQERKEIEQFIKATKVKTFDCPNEENIKKIDDYLNAKSITDSQRFQLQLEMTHWQICVGNYIEAESTINAIIADPKADQTQEYYALAVYQKGFIYDTKEDERRCDFYLQAKTLSLGKFDDISLSSELGLLTYCDEAANEGAKLKRLFDILEFYSLNGDAPTIAHIHNNIGLIYGRIGQHVLAAEQFQKTFELGFPHYSGSNKYGSLISVFTSLMASGQYDKAEKVIDELSQARSDVDEPLVHAWYYYAKGRYYHRLNKQAELSQTVNEWKPQLADMESTIFAGMHRWFEIEVCIDENELTCIKAFVDEEETNGPNALRFLGGNVDYLTLLANAYLALGDIEKASFYWTKFSSQLRARLASNQSSGKVLGVANLYNQIGELENTIVREQLNREKIVLGAVVVFLAATLVFIMLWRRKQAEVRSYDSVTTLLNSKTAISQIKRVQAPTKNKTNALALFDLANFKEVNRLLGSSNADEAIQQIALTFKHITRESDILGRFAPEQFILCLTDIEEEGARALFERISFALSNTNLGKHKGINISVDSNMSIYLANDAFDDLDEVLDDMMLSLSMK